MPTNSLRILFISLNQSYRNIITTLLNRLVPFSVTIDFYDFIDEIPLKKLSNYHQIWIDPSNQPSNILIQYLNKNLDKSKVTIITNGDTTESEWFHRLGVSRILVRPYTQEKLLDLVKKFS